MSIQKTGVLLSLFILPFAYADQQKCQEKTANYQACDNHLGWYIGGDIGYATTDINGSDLDGFYQQSGISASSIDVDDNDMAFSLFSGYQFSTNFAVEGGYIDLGERSLTFTGQDSDLANFYDNAEHVYPQSGDGYSIAIVGSWALSESFKVSAKLGYFDWEGDYITAEQSNQVGSDSISGGDIWFAGEVNYRVNDSFQLYLTAQRFELERDETINFAFGIRYYFGDEQGHKIKKKQTKPIEQQKTTFNKVLAVEPIKKLIIDSDKDGVFDRIDQCPNSDISYQVDEKGEYR